MNHAGINIGYGFTKLKTPRTSFRIPSVVAPSPDNLFTLRNTERVKVDGITYEIGAEATLINYNPSGHKIAIPKWCNTYQYRALMQLCIDKLAEEPDSQEDWTVVVGIAVNQAKDPAYIEKLKDLWIDDHLSSNGKTISIVDCRVAPEPVGAFWSVSLVRPEINEAAENSTIVVLDGGYYTFDWIVVRKKKLVWEACNAVNSGMHKIYLDIQKRIKATHQANIDLVEIEEAVSEKRPIYLRGKKFDLSPYLQQAIAQHIPNVLSRMSRACDEFIQSDSAFILTGGSAELLLPFLSIFYPDHLIAVPEDPQMANADGYLYVAQVVSRSTESAD